MGRLIGIVIDNRGIVAVFEISESHRHREILSIFFDNKKNDSFVE